MSNAMFAMGQAAAAGTALSGAWNLDYAYPSNSNAWDISLSGNSNVFNPGTQDSMPNAVFFSTDGSKMYVLGDTNNSVYQYNTYAPFHAPSATFVTSKSIGTQDSFPTGLSFSPDGTKMYVLGSGSGAVNEYTLSTAWDVSTASYVQNFSITAQDSSPKGLYFKPDGTKFYFVGAVGADVNEYSLSTAWDVSTASYVQNKLVSPQEVSPYGITFKPDGTKMYIAGQSGDDINEYTLSIPWSVSTASYSQAYFHNADNTPTGLFIHPKGVNIYFTGTTNTRVYQYTIGGKVTGTFPNDIYFKPDGTRCYVMDDGSNSVLQYNLSTPWDVCTATGNDNFSVGTLESTPHAITFKYDGTKMYVYGQTGDDINEYNLSTPWDITTAVFGQVSSVLGISSPQGIDIKPDGTKMYICGDNTVLMQYTMSTPWDVSTLSLEKSTTVTTTVSGMRFKEDGTMLFTTKYSSPVIKSYTLSTPWDIATLTSHQTSNVCYAQDTQIEGIFFKPDGTQMYIAGDESNKIHQYTLLNNQ